MFVLLGLVCSLLKHGNFCTESLAPEGVDDESAYQHEDADSKGPGSSGPKFKQSIFGEEALKISPAEPYCLRRPIRRGHLNISQHYPMQQVYLHL